MIQPFKAILSLFLLGASSWVQAQSLQQVSGFGSNPGDLRMYEYVPSPQPSGEAPLVVALHGCSQNASSFFDDTEWHRLADRYGFYLLFPEQKSSNNSNDCFNWFLSTDQERGNGEALSIAQMVDEMENLHPIDSGRVFVTGLSAGGAMSSVMMATYPELFEAGAPMAGLPYKSATNSSEAFTAMQGNVDKTPSQWADLVQDAYPSFSGDHPRAAIFHGTADGTVDPINARELMEQWTEVQGVDRIVDRTQQDPGGSASSVTKEVYTDGSEAVVARYSIDGMGHGIAIDPGSPLCKGKGGTSGSYAIDVGLFSSYWAARFFGIVPGARVRGPSEVNQGQQGLLFWTPEVDGSGWTWEVPSGASIVQGQGTDSIEVDWGSQAGYVKVTRTDSTGCQGIPDSLAVGITGIEDGVDLPQGLRLLGSNPSREGFEVELTNDAPHSMSVVLFDSRGRRLMLPQPELAPGDRLRFGKGLSSGPYILRVGDGSIRLLVP